jgi:hypothetical protein
MKRRRQSREKGKKWPTDVGSTQRLMPIASPKDDDGAAEILNP